MKKLFNFFAVFSILMVFFTGCDNFLNSNEDFINLMETEINYARAPLVNVLVGHNNDYYGTVGSGVVNYSVTAKVGFAFEVSFTLKSSAGNFIGWNAYTKYDPDIPANCKLLDPSFIEFMDNSRDKLTAKVKVLKETNEQIRLVPEVSAFPVMEVCLPSELIGITPVPVTFNPPQAIKALTPGQEYSVSATTTVDYGYSANAEECWKVYRKDTLGNEIEIVDDENITISKNAGTQLANGRSQSTIYITVGSEFSGRFFVSPRLITYPSMKVEVENFDSSLVKMSHSGTVSMAKGTPYEITLQTDPSVGFSGWKLCKKNNATLREIEELFPADKKTTTNISAFTTYSDEFIEVSSPAYDVSETGKTAGKVTASIKVTLKEDMDDLEYSYYLLPEFFKYPVVNVYSPDGYGFAGRISLTGAGFLDNDSVRMMMDDYEYTLTYKTNEDYSFAEPYWIVYETANPSQNLLDVEDARIELLKSSIVTDESGASSCSLSLTLKHNFETNLNIKPVVAQKPSMNISFDENVPSGINLSLGGNTITSGSVNSKSIKIVTGKTYTATVNIPKGYSFEGWKLVREISSADKLNWITESTKSTTDIIENASLEFDSAALAESPDNFVKLFNAKYDFELEGRNAGNTKATIDLLIKAELSDFSLNLIPVIKAVPEISFVSVNSDYGTVTPLSSDVRNLYAETKIDLSFKSTRTATAGSEIWKFKKWDSGSGSYSIDYSENVGYTSLDLTAALKDDDLKTKSIIIYNNDTEAEVQPNSKGEYITIKTAVLYVNKIPDANLQVSVEPEVYNTIKFVPGTNFEVTDFNSEVYIPKGITYNFELKTKPGYNFSSLGTPANGANTTINVTNQSVSNDGVSTVKGTITSTKNNGDAVVVTPVASALAKVIFGKPVLSASLTTENEDAGTMVPGATDFIYQVAGNSTSIKFETSGEFEYDGFAAGSTKIYTSTSPEAYTASYVVSTGTLEQAKTAAPSAKIIIHDIVETYVTDSIGQDKKRVTATLTVLEPDTDVTIKPVVKGKPSFVVSLDNAEKGAIAPATAKKILINEDYNVSYISSSGYGFEKWSVTQDSVDIPVLTLDEAKGAAGTSASSFVINLGTVPELEGNYSVSYIQNGHLTYPEISKFVGIIYNESHVESQTTEGVETVTAKFRLVKNISSAIKVSPVTYKHSYFYVADDENATVVPASTSKIMVKKGRDYDFRIVTDSGYMYSSLSFSGVTVANAGNAATPAFSSYTTQDAVCYNLVPSVNKDTGVVTVTGKLRMLKEPEKTIVLTPVIDTFPKITLTELNSGDTARLTLGNNTVSSGTITASMISDYEKSSINYVPKYIDYGIEVIPADGKGVYKTINYNTTSSIFNVYNSTGTKLDFRNCTMTTDAECPDFKSTDKLIIYGCQLVLMENGNYKATGKIRVKEGNYTIRPGVFTQPKFAIQSINAGDIASITFNGQRTNGESLAAQTLYSYGGVPKSYDFSIKLKEGLAVYTDNADEPFAADPDSARVSLKAYSTGNTELGCGYNYDYNIYNKNGDDDEETATVLHEIEQTFDGKNYILTGKIRCLEGENVIIKPNVYKMPVINIQPPYYEGDDGTPGTLLINKITQNQSYSSPVLIQNLIKIIYTASDGYFIREFRVYDSTDTLKSTYEVGPSSIIAGTAVAGLSFSGLNVESAARKKITVNMTVTDPSVDGYKIVPVYVKGSLGPSLVSCSLSYYPVKYTNTSNSTSTAVDLTNTTAATATTITTDKSLSITANANYYIDNTPLAAGGTQIASNGAKYTSTTLKNVFTGNTGSNSFSVTLQASNENFPGNASYVPAKIKVTEKLVGLYANMYYMKGKVESSIVRLTSRTSFDPDLIPRIYTCAGALVETKQTVTTDANFTKTTTSSNNVTTATFTFGLNFNIPFGGIHQFEISAIDSNGNETEKRTICLEYPRTEFSDTAQGAKMTPAAFKQAGGTTFYVRYTSDPTVTDFPYIIYYATPTAKCHFVKPKFDVSGEYDETVSILERSSSGQKAYIRLANKYGFLTLSRKASASFSTSIAGPGDIVYRKLNSKNKYVCSLGDYLADPSIGEPIAVIVSGTGSSSDTATTGSQIIGMGLKVPTQDYFYPGRLKFFNDVTETKPTTYQLKERINTETQDICGTSDGYGKNNLEQYQSKAFTEKLDRLGKNVPYLIISDGITAANPSSSQSFPVFSYAAHYAAIELNGFGGENWYIPSVAEIKFIQDEFPMFRNTLSALNVSPLDSLGTYWTSTTGTTAEMFYTYSLSLRSYQLGRTETPSAVNITTSTAQNYVRVFYDFTGELVTE